MTQTAFSVPFPKQWILSDGSPSVAFYKFIVDLFNSTSGAGIAPGTLLGNITAGTSPPIANTLSAILDALIGSVRGDLISRGAGTWGALALGANNTILGSNGTDATYLTVTAVLDSAIGSTRGEIAVRGAANWQALALGSTGKALLSDGTDVTYGLVASLAATVTLAAAGTITTAAGDLLIDSATHNLQLGTTAAVATIPATFVADHRIQIKDGAGATYYIAVSNVAW